VRAERPVVVIDAWSHPFKTGYLLSAWVSRGEQRRQLFSADDALKASDLPRIAEYSAKYLGLDGEVDRLNRPRVQLSLDRTLAGDLEDSSSEVRSAIRSLGRVAATCIRPNVVTSELDQGHLDRWFDMISCNDVGPRGIEWIVSGLESSGLKELTDLNVRCAVVAVPRTRWGWAHALDKLVSTRVPQAILVDSSAGRDEWDELESLLRGWPVQSVPDRIADIVAGEIEAESRIGHHLVMYSSDPRSHPELGSSHSWQPRRKGWR
jgi:hypothetical protein